MQKVIARKGSLTCVRDKYGRVWLCRRKKYKHNNRRQKPGRVIHHPIICMSRLKVKGWLASIDAIAERMEQTEKKEGIGKILASLLIPLPKVLSAVCEKQRKDVEELYKTIGWIWETKIEVKETKPLKKPKRKVNLG